MDKDRTREKPSELLTLALVAVGILGVINILWLVLSFRRRDNAPSSGSWLPANPFTPADPASNALPGPSSSGGLPSWGQLPAPSGLSGTIDSPVMSTANAYSLTMAQATLVAQAYSSGTEVEVYVAGPAGRYAQFTYDRNSNSGTPFAIAAGHSHTFRLQKNQVLYGYGSVDGVTVSVSTYAKGRA